MRAFQMWLAATAVAIAAGIVVPYFVLSGSPPHWTFLFWFGFGLAVIALVVVGVSGWRR